MYFTKSFKNLWNYTRNLLTIRNFTQSKIILHKRCLRCLWQILCLNRLPWSHLNQSINQSIAIGSQPFVPFAIGSNGNDCVLNMTQGEAAGAGQLDMARDHRVHYFHNLEFMIISYHGYSLMFISFHWFRFTFVSMLR